jgi:2-oxoglutarate ferredoxin oxidoreductase subunit gamma
VDIWEIPTAEIAAEFGNPRVQNVVMMGAYVKMTRMVTAESYLKSLKSILGTKKKAAMEINRKAFEAGFNYIE